MSAIALPPTRVPKAAPPVPTMPIYQLSVDQYHQMIDKGILTTDDRVELISGWLVPKMPKNPSHSAATRKLRVALERLNLAGCLVDSQEPITLVESEPEPDGRMVRGNPEQFKDRHPEASVVLLVAEVSNRSLSQDRGEKLRMYAEAKLPVYWIVNLVDNQIEVYTLPFGPAAKPSYGHRQDFSPNDEVPVVIDGREVGRIRVSDILP
jgi:hypothetical protein